MWDDVTNSEATTTPLRESVMHLDLDSSLDGLLGKELSFKSVGGWLLLFANLLLIEPMGNTFDLLGILWVREFGLLYSN
jgi:hypothetical protein